MITIEPFSADAWDEIWTLLQPVFAKGDTLAYATLIMWKRLA